MAGTVLGRDLRRVTRAATSPRYYEAVWRMFRSASTPVATGRRYLFANGPYPWTAAVRTPVGPISLTMWHHQDVLTLNEIFFRRDYGPGGQAVIVDVGANIGISAAFFLSRRPDTVVHAVEPMFRNAERFRHNVVTRFGDRARLTEAGLWVRSEAVEFISEETGRLSGVAAVSVRTGERIMVQCLAIGDFLEPILSEHGRIGLLKVDTEGTEAQLIDAVPADMWSRIDAAVWETNHNGEVAWRRS